MIEILGSNLDRAILDLNIIAVKKYGSESGVFAGDDLQVWELSREELAKLDSTPDKDWEDEYGWYGYFDKPIAIVAGEINYNYPTITVNNQKVINPLSGGFLDVSLTSYKDFAELAKEINAWSSSVVCSLVNEFAKANNMKVSEFLKKYQG